MLLNQSNHRFNSQDKSSESAKYLCTELIKQHRLFVEKLIPEIELHLMELTANCSHNDRLALLMCLKWISDYGKKLREHILFEEEHVFSIYFKGESYLTAEAKEFINHHDDFETRLQYYLQQIKNSLMHLSNNMSFRILILKLEILHEAMLEHAELENSLMS